MKLLRPASRHFPKLPDNLLKKVTEFTILAQTAGRPLKPAHAAKIENKNERNQITKQGARCHAGSAN